MHGRLQAGFLANAFEHTRAGRTYAGFPADYVMHGLHVLVVHKLVTWSHPVVLCFRKEGGPVGHLTQTLKIPLYSRMTLTKPPFWVRPGKLGGQAC